MSVKEQRKFLRDLSYSALGVALAIVLSFIGFQLPMGGKVSLEMLPIIYLSFISLRSGIMAGFLYGIAKVFLESVPILHPIQFILDYPLAFTLLGLAGLMREKPLLGGALAITLRYVVHVISGFVFFSSYAKGDPLLYSLVYNAIYMLPSGIATLILLKVLMMNVGDKGN